MGFYSFIFRSGCRLHKVTGLVKIPQPTHISIYCTALNAPKSGFNILPGTIKSRKLYQLYYKCKNLCRFIFPYVCQVFISFFNFNSRAVYTWEELFQNEWGEKGITERKVILSQELAHIFPYKWIQQTDKYVSIKIIILTISHCPLFSISFYLFILYKFN